MISAILLRFGKCEKREFMLTFPFFRPWPSRSGGALRVVLPKRFGKCEKREFKLTFPFFRPWPSRSGGALRVVLPKSFPPFDVFQWLSVSPRSFRGTFLGAIFSGMIWWVVA